MSELTLSLTDAYKKRFEDIVRDDTERKGIYYHNERKYWVIYDYAGCSELLNSHYVTKNRMLVPLSIFQQEKAIIERFMLLINQSLIFRDDCKSDVVRLIHQNFKKLPCDEMIERLLLQFREKKYLDEHDLINLNNTLAAMLVGLEPARHLSDHAYNVGMLFDGRVKGKEHFVDIAHSFMAVFEACRDMTSGCDPCTDVQASDRAIAYIAAHQTTMQLIVATLWAISHFSLRVNADNVRDIVVEASRFYSPVLSVGRMMSQDLSFRGLNLRKGDRVMFYTALANFDAGFFDEPFQFIPGRKEKSLSFGTGMHMCIGMGIALNFASSFIARTSSNGALRNVRITELAEGVSALGASRFSMGMDCHELAED